MKKALFIINPISGKGHIRHDLLDVLSLFSQHDYEISIFTTKHPGHAKELVASYIEGKDLIICSGGDGTLNEVVSSMISLEKKLPVGYLPAGTTNDFATSMGIEKQILPAAETIIQGLPFAFDVGKFHQSHFLYIAAFGIFTNVSYSTPQEAKHVLGQVAYFLEGIKCLTDIKGYAMKITIDEQVIEDEFIFGMVSNSSSIGGFRNIVAEQTELNDGLFEIVLVKKPNNFSDFKSLVFDLLTQEMDSSNVLRFHAKHLVFSSEQDIDWTLDGEHHPPIHQVSISNLKEAAYIIRSFPVSEL